jgi:hypothetical protein
MTGRIIGDADLARQVLPPHGSIPDGPPVHVSSRRGPITALLVASAFAWIAI